MSGLFELEDFAETRVEWVPLYKPFGITLLSLLIGTRCRDCGTSKTSGTSGSRAGFGSFELCDDCAQLDCCLTRQHERGLGVHISRWGSWHHADGHDDLTAAQTRRRAAYARKVAA